MGIYTNRWWPGTCPCVINEAYDSDTRALLGFHSVVSKCPAHQTVADADLYGVILTNVDSEQGRIAKVNRFMMENIPWLAVTKHADNGVDSNQDWIDGVVPAHTFTGTGANRVLKISFAGRAMANKALNASEKNQISAFANREFGGNGKVQVD